METWQTLGIAVGAAVAFGALATVRRITVHEFEQALLYVRGRLRRILSGGAYWMFRPLQTVTVVDMRSRALSVAGQEVLSSDGVSVKVSLAFRIKIADLAKAIHGAQDFQEALYLESQLVLRSLLSALPVDEIIARRRWRSAGSSGSGSSLEPRSSACPSRPWASRTSCSPAT